MTDDQKAFEVHRLADGFVPRFEPVFKASAERLRERATDALIEADYARGLAEPKNLFALVDQMTLAKETAHESEERVYSEILVGGAKLEGIDLGVHSPWVGQAARTLTANLVTGVNAETKKAIRQVIFEAIRDGDPPKVAAKRIRQIVGLTHRDAVAVRRLAESGARQGAVDRYATKLLNRRALAIARTETISASAAGQRLAWEEMARDNLIDTSRFRERWLVTRDDRTCFPAGTPVQTPSGPRPIETLRVGDLVETPLGPKPVTDAGERAYGGMWAYWETEDGGWSLSTADHLIWTTDGWVEALALRCGDLLDRGGDNLTKVVRILGFFLGDADDGPPALREACIAARIACRIRVPVSTIHFQAEAKGGDNEVDGVATDLVLVGEENPELFQDSGRARLGLRGAAMAAVARSGAELPFASGSHSHGNATLATVDVAGWSVAFLRAVRSVSFIPKRNTATSAGSKGSLLTAGPRASRVAVGGCGANCEVVLTSRATLSDEGGLSGRFVASARAVRSFGWPSKCLAALSAGARWVLDRCGVVAVVPAVHICPPRALLFYDGPTAVSADIDVSSVMSFPTRTRTPFALPTDGLRREGNAAALTGTVHPVTVYDLEVNGPACFYADGYLVHNCPRCAPMDGKLVSLGSMFVETERGVLPSQRTPVVDGAVVLGPPLHTLCRCCVVADFG